MRKLQYLLMLTVLASCGQQQSNTATAEASKPDSTGQQSITVEEDSDEFKSQLEINMESYDDFETQEDSVEQTFQQVMSALPKHQSLFKEEKAAWEKFMKEVNKVASCEDHGSSTPMFISAVLLQATQVRSASLRYISQQLKGKPLPLSSTTTFTPTMISDAYSAFIKTVEDDEFEEQKAAYAKALRKEKACWDQWIKCRNTISQQLPGDVKKAYDSGTNQMLRTKLLQLKNQNRNLGLISGEIEKCALPENCSDKALLEYPGFDVIWAKHCEDLDWYPTWD